MYTVTVRPIPKGISRDELLADYLSPLGEISALRFGQGRGITADCMFIDFKTSEAAVEAVKKISAPSFFAPFFTSRFSAELSAATKAVLATSRSSRAVEQCAPAKRWSLRDCGRYEEEMLIYSLDFS